MASTFPFSFPATFEPGRRRGVQPLPTPQEATANPSYMPLEFTTWLEGIFPSVIGELGVPSHLQQPISHFRYIDNRRQVIVDSAKQRPGIRIADKNLNIMLDLIGERSCAYEELVADTGSAKLTIRYDHPLTDWMIHETKDYEDLHLIIDPNPSKPDWRTRWGGKITEINIKRDSQGIHSIELTALHMREHAKKLLMGANPIFPPEVQLPKMWVLPGPTRSILAISMFINLARLFFPILSVPTNIFNPAGWINPIGTNALANLDPLNWPLQVQFVNPLTDQSRWSVLGATWTDWHSAMGQMLVDSGVVFRAYTWLETDQDSPHQEINDALRTATDAGLGQLSEPIEKLIRPRRNCVVFALEDKSGRNGPSGTAADGLLNLIGVTLDDLITPVMVNVDTGKKLDGMPVVDAAGRDQSEAVQRLLGVAPEIPKVIWWEGDYNGIVESTTTIHKGAVKTAMTGGRSPAIVNQAQTFGIRYALAQLSAVINYYVGGAYQTPGSPGLDNLYQGQLDNVLLAWQRFTDPMRALHSGDFAWNEIVERGSGTAYVLSSIVTLRAGLYRSRSYTGFVVKVQNGKPHLVDVDVRLGDRAGFEEDQIIYVDQITAVKREWSRDQAMTIGLSIGDDKDKEDPFAGFMRSMAAIWSAVGSFLGEGTIFGG